MLFSRGSAAGLTSDRAGATIIDIHTGLNDGSRGNYVGGGADLMITKDLWGMLPGVAPKVKFRQGTDFQPWMIPAEVDFHVISLTSSQVNYVDIGVQFGGGAEKPGTKIPDPTQRVRIAPSCPSFQRDHCPRS